MKVEGKGNVWLGSDPFELPLLSPLTDYGKQREQRAEHAMLMRCEGQTLKEIGLHLGVSQERARHWIARGGRRLQRAMTRTKFRWL